MRIKNIMITITEKCNLNCSYCYEAHKSKKEMSVNVAVELIQKELSDSIGYDAVEIAFHGGEPFICFGKIQQICEKIWKDEYSIKYYFFATTNGTYVHGKVKKWLQEHRNYFICCLSLDGNKYMHNINRDNSFDKIDYLFFKNTWPIQEIKMTISQDTLPHLYEGILFLHKIGFIISENFGYGIDWNSKQNGQILYAELDKLITYYCDNPSVKRCRLLSAPIEYYAYDFPEDKHCSIGGEMTVYDVDGIKYPCHFFQPNAIGTEKSQAAQNIDFSTKEVFVDPFCEECNARKVCATCYGANYAATENPAIRDKSMCVLTKISAKATAYLYYLLIQKYGIKSLEYSQEKKKAIVIGIQEVNKIEVENV